MTPRSERRAAPRIAALPAPVAQAHDGSVASLRPEVFTVRNGEGTLNGRPFADSAGAPDTEGAHTVLVAIADAQAVSVFGDLPERRPCGGRRERSPRATRPCAPPRDSCPAGCSGRAYGNNVATRGRARDFFPGALAGPSMKPVMTTLITGRGAGIGLQMARLPAACRHRRVPASPDDRRLEAAADEPRITHGAEVHVHAIDLSGPGAAQHVFEFTGRQGLHVDALIDNAGRSDPRDVTAAGVALLLDGGSLRGVGLANHMMVPSSRLAPRPLMAALSKRMLEPLELPGPNR